MYISSHVHHKESCYKVAKCIYHHVCVTREVVIKLQNVYMITCASQGRFVEGCGMYISSRVHRKESCYKIAACIYDYVCITRNVGRRLRNVCIITCASQKKLL